MRRHTLRTAVLRLSAFAMLLVSFACCAGPTETVEQASEALKPLPLLEPATPLTISRPPTEEELATATAEVEQFLHDHLPKWKVYLSGQDFYFGTARGDRGVKHFYGHPIDLDRACALVLVPEGGETRPETWLYLSYQRYWLHGASYLTDELKLSLLDVLGILVALEDAGDHVPPVSSLDQGEQGNRFRYEDGLYGPLPAVPPDWISDNHTWTGGPPSNRAHQPALSPQPPSNTRPPRSKDWHTWPVTPPPRHTGPHFESPPRHTGPPFESFNGVSPTDKPVGRYPGWDKPHPGEGWEKFRCGGKVYEGYRSDCPDYQPRPIDERWKYTFSDVGQELTENARHTLELIRTDPNCTFMCKLIGATPALLHMVCIEAPVVHPAMTVICAVFGSLKLTVGASIAGLKFDDACEKWCQKPPQGAPGRQP